MRTSIIGLALLMLTGNLFAQATDGAVTLETQTGNIEGTLLLPPTGNNVPVVLIIAGSGPTDRNGNNPMMTNNSLKMIAEGLSEKGIATLRYDKRGIAESQGAGVNESDLRFEIYVEDAIEWVEWLQKDGRFSEIYILGHSEGSLIGMIAAQEKEVKKFISVAGIGSPAGEILREQLNAQSSMALELALPYLEKLEKGETIEEVPKMLYSLFRPSVQPYMISWLKYDPSKEIAKLKKPVLIVQGTTDIQVPVSEAEKLAAANKQAEVRIIEGMNHVLKESEPDRQKNLQTYTNPTLPLKKGLIDAIVEFIVN